MSSSKVFSLNNQGERESRRPYRKPSLISLGLVAEMTTSGSGDRVENQDGPNNCNDPAFELRTSPPCGE